MPSIRKRLSAFCLGVLAVVLLGCGGDAQGEIPGGTDFSLSLPTSQYKVPPGASLSVPIAITWAGCPPCTPGDVTFELLGLPPGLTANSNPPFSPNPNASATRLQLNLSPSAPGGTYDLLIKGSSGPLVHTKALQLVLDGAAPTFSATFTPPSLAMDANHNQLAVAVEISRTGGFSDPVTIHALPLPGFRFDPPSLIPAPANTGASLAPAEVKTLTIMLDRDQPAPPGTYTISVQLAAGGQLQQKELPVSVYPLPEITAFSASPSQIRTGFSASLLPVFTGGTGVVTPPGSTVLSGQPLSVSPTVTTPYTLTVTNPAGSPVTRSTTVTVQNLTVVLTPSSRFVTVGKNVSLAVSVTGATNPAVTWTLVEPAGGTLLASGASATYTAPATPGVYHVRATSVEDPSKFDEFTATVVPPPVITSFSASSTLLDRGDSTILTAVFSGGTGVIDNGVGSVNSGVGVSAAPLMTTLYALTVTNLAGDKDVKDVTVTVNGVAVLVSPNPVTLYLGASQLFTATVTGAVDTSVTWTVKESGGGTITQGGLYTAPPVVDGTYHVIATSKSDPSVSDTAEVVVKPITIYITPSAPSSLIAGQIQPFTATVLGTADTLVTWAVVEPMGGTITQSGLYTAPATLGTYHITATSHADATKIASVVTRVGTVSVTLTQPNPRQMTAGERYHFAPGTTATNIYRISGASDNTGTLSSDEPGSSWGVDFIARRSQGGVSPSGQQTSSSEMSTTGNFYYQTGQVPGIYHLRITSNEDPFAYAEYTFEVLQRPIISSFTLTRSGGVSSLNAIFINDTSPGSTAVFTDFTGAFVGNAVSGQPFSVGPAPKEAYRLTVTNSLYATTRYALATATATASTIVVTINQGATWKMAGKSATTNPTKTFTATAAGSTQGVTWTVFGGADPGSVDYYTGLYTPPTVPGTFTVTATSLSDPTKSDSIAVTVIPLFIWPGNQVIGSNNKLVLRASALGTGVAQPGFTWSMDPSQTSGAWGSVDAFGVYTAPGTDPTSNPIIWVALSADPTKVKTNVSLVVNSAIDVGGKLRGSINVTPLDVGVTDARSAHTLTTLANGEVILIGGENPIPSPAGLKNPYLYKPSVDKFFNLTSLLSTVRKWHTATLLLDGSVLIAGGLDENDVPLCTAERFIPYPSAGGYFVPVTGMLVKERSGHTATLLPNGKVLLVGGQESPGPGPNIENSAELYDPLTDTFALVPSSMRSTRVNHRAVRLLDGRVMILGGSKDGLLLEPSFIKEVEIYNPATNAFINPYPSDLPFGIMDPTMDLVSNGDVLVAGGLFNPSAGIVTASGQVLRYTPLLNSWTFGFPAMGFTRVAPMGMMLPDNTYAIWGGSGNVDIDFFDPFSGLFDTPMGLGANPINWEGQNGRLVLMLNGRLLAAGSSGTSSAFRAVTFP